MPESSAERWVSRHGSSWAEDLHRLRPAHEAAQKPAYAGLMPFRQEVVRSLDMTSRARSES